MPHRAEARPKRGRNGFTGVVSRRSCESLLPLFLKFESLHPALHVYPIQRVTLPFDDDRHVFDLSLRLSHFWPFQLRNDNVFRFRVCLQLTSFSLLAAFPAPTAVTPRRDGAAGSAGGPKRAVPASHQSWAASACDNPALDSPSISGYRTVVPLSAEAIEQAFGALSVELERRARKAEIIVVGGAALVLLFRARESTKDVDGYFLRPEASVIREAAKAVADRLNLPNDWLNDGAKGYFVGVTVGETLFDSPALIVRAASTPQLLAMKLAAWRDAIDRADAQLLLSRMSGSAEEVWRAVVQFVPRINATRRRTRLKTYGTRCMNITELVRALVAGDLLKARQLVADARRTSVRWEALEQPIGLTDRELVIAAGITELLAFRAGGTPPAWTQAVGATDEIVVLDPGLEQMPRSFARAKASGPEPLRNRNLIALPDFLDVA